MKLHWFYMKKINLTSLYSTFNFILGICNLIVLKVEIAFENLKIFEI